MDIVSLLAATPYASIIPYITFVIAIATAVLLLLPAPTTASSTVYSVIYGAIHFIGNLKPAPAPVAVPTPAAK